MIKKILSIVVSIICTVLITHIAFAVNSSLDENTQEFFAQNNILFYEPCANTSGGICGDNKDYEGNQVWTDEQMGALQANQPFYEKAAKDNDIPWQLIATIHLREHGLARDNPGNGQGPYQFYSSSERSACTALNGASFSPGPLSDEEFQKHTDCAAKFTKEKYGGGYDLNTDDGVKNMFFSYNGRAQAYIRQALDLGFSQEEADRGEGSPYVMNKYDEKRDPNKNPTGWGQIKTDGGGISYPANQDYGAFVYYKAIADCSGGKSSSSNSNNSEKSQSEDGGNVTIIGDSITEGSQDAIKGLLPNADVTAQVSKQFGHGSSSNPGGLDILTDFKNQNKIRKKLVFALGTNGDVSQSDLDQVLQTAGDNTEVFFVTNWTTSNNYDHNNSLFNNAPSNHNNVRVIDWKGVVSADPGKYLGGDGIHPNDEGKQKFAELIKEAVSSGYECNDGSGNSISDIANQLAWPYGGDKTPQTPKPEFVEAAQKVGTDSSAPDCGKFVATVILSSGADPDFPKSYTVSQKEHMESSSLWKEVSNSDESNLMPGDVLVNDEHIMIYVGDSKNAEASMAGPAYYAVIHDTSFAGGTAKYKAFRLTSDSKQVIQTKNGVNCGCVDDGVDGLKDGGFATKEEAEAVLIPKYKNDPLVPPLNLPMPATGDYHHNCVAFSNWFLKEFTTITNGGTVAGNGNELAHNLYSTYHSSFPELKESSTPSVYSIASWSVPKPNTPDGNHTGVVVGINQSTGKILIAEAGWNSPNFTGVHEYDLNSFIGDGSYYVDVNSYLNKGGLK